MAGKRQHYIPQFLQRGFSSHFNERNAFTWVHRKSVPPFNSNIINVGVEGNFYSMGEELDLDADPAITTLENSLASLIGKFRAGYLPREDDSGAIARLLAHLELRTRHIRQSFLMAGTALLDELLKHLSDEEIFSQYFLRKLQRDPSLMQDAMAKEFKRRGVSEQFLPQAMEMVKPLLVQVMPDVALQMSAFAREFRLSLSKDFGRAVKSGHVKALVKTLAPERKVELFQGLRFRVDFCEESTFPLGDSAVIFHVKGDHQFKPFFDRDDSLIAALLPIDTNRILVGSYESYIIDSGRIRSEIARCSLEYFIASQGSPVNDDLQPLIGQGAQLLSSNQIKEMVEELVRGNL